MIKKPELLPGSALGSVEISLCGEEGITFANQTFIPDATNGYFKFRISNGFPVTLVGTREGQALHPNVIAKSYKTLEHQNINYEHQLASYGVASNDRVIGCVVAVDFPNPTMNWTIGTDPDKAPGITGVGVLFKQTQGMARMMGQHMTGSKKYSVSQEVLWPFEEAGFALELNGKDPIKDFSPPDFLKAGYEYIPMEEAPEELRATYSKKRGRIVANWKGRKARVLLGGLSNPVHYAGMGVVGFGAEPQAEIQRLAASGGSPLERLADSLLATFKK